MNKSPGCSRSNRDFVLQRCLGRRLGLGYRVDGLEDTRDDLVRVAFRVRTAIFKIALVAILDEVYGQADGSAAIGETVAELVDGLGFVESSEAQVVIRAIHGDVLGDEFFECRHEGFKIFLAADFANVLGREVAVHARAIPVALDRLAVQDQIHLVLLAESVHKIASDPDIVRGLCRALGEDLELPLTLGDFRIDAFVVDPGVETEIQVLVDDLATPQ